MYAIRGPNRLINSKPLNQYPSLVERVTCPICCLVFQDKHKPMISCPSRHTICASCLEGIIEKSIKTPQSEASCPMCRQRIELPLQLNEQFTEFLKFLNGIGQIYQAVTIQSQQIRDKNAIIFKLQKEASRMNSQIFELRRKNNINEAQLVKLRQQIRKLKQNELLNLMNKKSSPESDPKIKIQQQQQNIKVQTRTHIPNKEVEIDKKPPLNQLFDDIVDDAHLTLNRKGFGPLQVEFLVIHDMSKLIELSLSFNSLGNAGFKMLVEQAHMPNLTALRVLNNQISELPDMQPLSKLETFDISNYLGQGRLTYNSLRATEIQKLVAHKWQKLTTLNIQFNNDLLWDNDETTDKIVEQWPAIRFINISCGVVRTTKKKCQQLTNLLTNKAHRPKHLRILVSVQSI